MKTLLSVHGCHKMQPFLENMHGLIAKNGKGLHATIPQAGPKRETVTCQLFVIVTDEIVAD